MCRHLRMFAISCNPEILGPIYVGVNVKVESIKPFYTVVLVRLIWMHWHLRFSALSLFCETETLQICYKVAPSCSVANSELPFVSVARPNCLYCFPPFLCSFLPPFHFLFINYANAFSQLFHQVVSKCLFMIYPVGTKCWWS